MRVSERYILASFLGLFLSFTAFADGGAGSGYSPYSKFGIGRIFRSGSAYTASMGGTGVAGRDHRYVNIMNPAAVTARDTMSFMADFSVNQNNIFFQQGGLSSANNTFNLGNITFSFPIWRYTAMMLGVTPYSSVGYDVLSKETATEIIGHLGNITDSYTGTGGLYNAYIAYGASFWKRLSIGVQGNFYFGNMEKKTLRSFTKSEYRDIYSGSQMNLRGINAKFGIQYQQPLGKTDKMVIGATYTMKTRLNGDNSDVAYAIQNEITDTLRFSNTGGGYTGVDIPAELSVGISYTRADKWRTEFNYTFSDWSKSGMDRVTGFKSTNFSSCRSQSFNAGFEITPNRSDIRYYLRHCSYRIGAYYTQNYYTYYGNNITSTGITLGVSFPVFRWYNAITVAVDAGQTGNLKDNMIRERYIGFKVAMNVFDIWFIKHRYD